MLIGINDLANREAQSIWPSRWDNEIDNLGHDIVSSVQTNTQTLLDVGIGEVWAGTQPNETVFPIYNE